MSYRIGLDIGVASCGWSVLRTDENGLPFQIINLGSVVFQKGETPKTGNSLAADRRDYRASRRLNRRQKFRKYRVKRLFINNDLLTKHQINNVFKLKPMPSVYQLRAKGLKHPLNNTELFIVLYYFAGHRGFHSNRKYARKNAGKLIKSIRKSQNWIKSSHYQTVGQLLAYNPNFKDQKRNHDYNNGYLVSTSRSMINDEANRILGVQSKFNNKLSNKFINKYFTILDGQRSYDQGPSKPSQYAGNQIEKMIGKDTYDHTQQRAAKATYTFEYYRLLDKLNNLRYKTPLRQYVPLDDKQRKIVIDLCFKRKRVTYKQIAKALGLNRVKFNLTRSNGTKFTSLRAIHEISDALPSNLEQNTKLIDAIGEILTKFSSDDMRKKAFDNRLKLPKNIISKLLSLNYSKFGDLSLKTMRKIIPYMEKYGTPAWEALRASGYKKPSKITTTFVYKNVKNPVVMRAFTIVRKVVRAIINRYGKPDYINVELARDLAKSHKDRQKIKRVQKKFAKKNRITSERLRSNGIPVNGQNILIDNLWHEQQGIDPYTGNNIDIGKAFSGMYYNIDHIVPYSWTLNDNYTNKVLTSTKANEDKANRLPMQYLLNDTKRKNFLIYFANNYIKNYKKKTNLLKNYVSVGQIKEWKQKNLNDTRWITKLVADYLEQNINFNNNDNLYKYRVIRSNGSMTAKLRHRWGLVKVRANGDKHHAMDATVLASITPALVKRVSDFAKYQELKNNPELWKQNDFKALKHRTLTSKLFKKFFNSFPLPWPDFREELVGRLSECPSKFMSNRHWKEYTTSMIMDLKPIHVVHRVSHHINGKVSGDTLRSAKYLDKNLIMSRAHVDKLKLNKKDQIKAGYYIYHPNECNLEDTKQLIKQLKLHGNKGSKAFPKGYMTYHDKNGYQHVVRRVKVFRKSNSGVLCNNGHAIKDNGKIVRIDIFKNIKNRKYCYVPIYLKDVLKSKLPNIIANSGKKVKRLSNQDKFEFSLYQYTPVHVEFKKPRKIKWLADQRHRSNKVTDFYGYYLNPNVNLGQLDFISFDRSFKIHDVGIGTIKQFKKYNIDYLGNIHRINEKKRLSFRSVK